VNLSNFQKFGKNRKNQLKRSSEKIRRWDLEEGCSLRWCSGNSEGARAVSLRLPLGLPLPLNRTTYKGRLSSLLSIAHALRGAARSNKKPLLSLRIEGPTSLSSTPSMSPNDKLKLRLAPGQVELSSRAMPVITDEADEPHKNTGLWPLLSLNGSDASLQGFEELLASVLGKKGFAAEGTRLSPNLCQDGVCSGEEAY
jgi:hypothetical protein